MQHSYIERRITRSVANMEQIRQLSFVQRQHLKQKILQKRKIQGGFDCWIWTGGKRQGYGLCRITPSGPTFSVHVISHVLFDSEVNAGCELSHRCRTKACFNPTHIVSEPRMYNLSRNNCSNMESCWHKPGCLI